jgi:serine/threonine protein kinase
MPSLSTHREYQDAIQNPRSCFSHPELQLSRPETDKLGLPRPRSGNFAVVFPLVLGSNKWAVRCFTTYHPDQEMRYQKISQHLKQQALPYTVGFEFIKQGIKVKGSWYPILRMEWVEGESLLKYIERNLNKPAVIESLAEQFYRLVSDLRKCGIAHGDLQHGNIIVVNGGCRLVDYDGMFVPGLEGLASNELGHPNYQPL